MSWPDPANELARGVFLTASRNLLDPNFSQTVVLLLDYGAEGALGLIINRPTDIELAAVLPDLVSLEGRGDLVFVGGPVGRDHLVVLIRSAVAPAQSGLVVGDVYVTGSVDVLREFLDPAVVDAEFHAYAGYAGWGPGQLDGEVSRGDWHVSPADSETVFELPASQMWPALIRRTSGQWVWLPPTERARETSPWSASGSAAREVAMGTGAPIHAPLAPPGLR